MAEIHLMPSFCRQPVQNGPGILHFLLCPDLFRDIGGPGVHLLDKGGQHCRVRLLLHTGEIIVFPSQHPSATDKEHLHNRLVAASGQCDNIPVLVVVGGDLLLLRHLLDAVDLVTAGGRILKPHLFGGPGHLLRQFCQNPLCVPLEEPQRLLEILLVLLLSHPALTGRQALANLMIEAGALLSGILRKISAAVPEMIQLVHQFDCIPYRLAAGERAEITTAVPLHLTRKKKPWKGFLYTCFQIRV